MPDSIRSALSDALRLEASIFFRLKLAAPWGMTLSSTSDLRLHAMKRGCCWIGGGVLAPVRLGSGQIILLGGGQERWIADRPGRSLLASEEAGHRRQRNRPPFQVGQLTDELICGRAQIRGDAGWLASLLPDVLHFRRRDLAGTRIWSIVAAIAATSSTLEDEDSGVLDRLTEALFLRLLERAPQLDLEVGRLGGARSDPQVRKALVLIHTRLSEPWTVQALAKEAGLSRATLVRRFKKVLGSPVMEYVSSVRMQRTKQLLLSGATLSQVAGAVGYRSPEALRKAFRRYVGSTPAAYVRRWDHEWGLSAGHSGLA